VKGERIMSEEKTIEHMTNEELIDALVEEAYAYGAYGFEMKREKEIKAEIFQRIMTTAKAAMKGEL